MLINIYQTTVYNKNYPVYRKASEAGTRAAIQPGIAPDKNATKAINPRYNAMVFQGMTTVLLDKLANPKLISKPFETPITNPIVPSTNNSNKTANITCERGNPMALIIPISRFRSATLRIAMTDMPNVPIISPKLT